MALPDPRACSGNISPISTHTNGPMLNAKHAMYTITHTKVSQAKVSAPSLVLGKSRGDATFVRASVGVAASKLCGGAGSVATRCAAMRAVFSADCSFCCCVFCEEGSGAEGCNVCCAEGCCVFCPGASGAEDCDVCCVNCCEVFCASA